MIGTIKKTLMLFSMLYIHNAFAEWYIDPAQCTPAGLLSLRYTAQGLYNGHTEISRLPIAEIWCASPVMNDYGNRLNIQIGYEDNSTVGSFKCEAWAKDGDGTVIDHAPAEFSNDGTGVIELQSAIRDGAIPLPKSLTLYCLIPNKSRYTMDADSGITSIRVF